MRRMIRLWVAIPLAVVAVVGLFTIAGAMGCGGEGTADPGGGTDQQTLEDPAAFEPRSDAEGVQGNDAGTSGKSTSGGGSTGQDFAAALPPDAALSAHHLIRTGDLSLLVDRGTLLSAADRIRSMTAAMGGYVMSSAVGSEQPGIIDPREPQPLDAPSDDDATIGGATAADEASRATDPYATIAVRIPEHLFDSAVKRFAKLGDVTSVSTSSQDVTSQYVDLQARLRHFRAVERRLVGFLAETDNVNQMLAVQDRIDDVQLTIEQLSAQLTALKETTTYGTLSILVREKGVPQAGTIDPSDTFGGTFVNSLKLLGRGARVTGLVVTALLPFIVVLGGIGLLVWYVLRRLRRSRREPGPIPG